MKIVSLKDIAVKCRVSVATVSKALNDQKDISAETKAKIKEAAQEMGYFPHAQNRALKARRSFTIGVLYREEADQGLTHEYFTNVLNGFKNAAENLGYDISFINKGFEMRQMTYYEHCSYRKIEGVLILSENFHDPQVIELMEKEIPVITIDYISQNCTSVGSNNVKGMQDLVNYIYLNGHRRIAYIHGQSVSSVTRERLTSFYQTAELLGLNIPDHYVIEAEYLNTEKAAAATWNLLKLKEPPTCILYADDTALIGGRNVLAEAGLRIPSDISIAGYDGIRMSQLLHPRLTTIHQDTRTIGEVAAKRLIRAIEKPKTTLVEQIVIDGKLLVGESVGKVHIKTNV